MPDDEVRLKRGSSAPSPRRRLVIGEDELAPPMLVQSGPSGYAGPPPRRPARTGGDVALGVAAVAVKLLSALVIVLGAAGYVYGGTDAGHRRCLEHRLTGGSGLAGELACAVEH